MTDEGPSLFIGIMDMDMHSNIIVLEQEYAYEFITRGDSQKYSENTQHLRYTGSAL